MTKNWLIRTRQKQILGPIGREKLVELLSKNLLAPEDEICSGNGHWFYVKETALMNKYIHEGVKQSFNPISEAKDVLHLGEGYNSANEADDASPNSSLDSTIVLKMPGYGEKSSEIKHRERRAKAVPKKVVEEIDDTDHFPVHTDLEYPVVDETPSADPPILHGEKHATEGESKESAPAVVKKKIRTNPALVLKIDAGVNGKCSDQAQEFSKSRNDHYLFYILATLGIVVLMVVFYYRKVLNRPLPFLSDATAQELFLDVQKKNFLSDFSLQSQLGEIKFSQNIFGPYPNEHSEHPMGCPERPWMPTDSFFVLLAQNKKEWFEWCLQCRHQIGTETKLFELLQIFNNFIPGTKLSLQLKRRQYDIGNLETALKIIEANARIGQGIITIVDQILISLSLQNEKSSQPQELSLWLHKIRNIENENVLVPLLTSVLALRHSNKGMAHKAYQKIFNLGPWDVFARPHFFSVAQMDLLQNNVNKVLKYTKLHSSDQFYSNILFHHLALLDGSMMDQFAQENARPLTLVDIRTNANSYVDSKVDPLLWFDYLYRRSTENELNNFLTFLIKKDNDISGLRSAWGLFILHENGRQFLNDNYNRIVETLWQGSSLGSRLLALKAFEKNPALHREIMAKINAVNRPLFEEKRRFFRQMIQSGRGIFYALYNLYKLGDMDETLLLLLLLR